MQFIVGESFEDGADLALGIILRKKRCGGSAQEPIAGDVERFGDAYQNIHAEITFSRFDVADVGVGDFRCPCEFFLADARFLTRFADAPADFVIGLFHAVSHFSFMRTSVCP